LLSFEVDGPGGLIGVGNGDPTSHEPDKAFERSAFNGLCMAIVQSRRGLAGSTPRLRSPG
jgi:beta-galactosidase